METTTVELSHKWMLYTQMALAALPHSPHSSRGLPHVLVPALVHVPKSPHANPELQTDTNNRRFLVQTKHILSEYNQIIDYTEILAMGFERGVIRIEHPQLGGYMFCNQMTSNRLSM